MSIDLTAAKTIIDELEASDAQFVIDIAAALAAEVPWDSITPHQNGVAVSQSKRATEALRVARHGNARKLLRDLERALDNVSKAIPVQPWGTW